jgi:serine/threonine protein kinase
VPDGFFAQLFGLLDQLHRRGIADVDTNKPENILLGEDGRPHLIDFQISYDLREFGDWFPNRWWLRRRQHADVYHVRKHHRRLRPDEMTPEELERAAQVGPMIKLHRVVTRPFKRIRRRTLQRMRDAGRLLPEGSK